HYGHPAGDGALRAVADTLVTQCRTGDRAYRYGGEEFLLILPAQAAPGATVALERIRRAVESLGMAHIGNPPSGVLTISAGIAIAARSVDGTAESLLAEADTALYEAKEGGRNRVVV